MKSRYTFIIFAVFVAIGVVAVGLTHAVQFSENTPDQVSVPTSTRAPTPSVSIDTQRVQDTMGLFSVNLPADWAVLFESQQGVRLSGITAESPNFLMESDTEAQGPFTPIYYRHGAYLQITVEEGENPGLAPAGEIISQEDRVIDGKEAQFFIFREPSTQEGELRQLLVVHDGNTYSLRFGYNPVTFTEGSDVFEGIIGSFHLVP